MLLCARSWIFVKVRHVHVELTTHSCVQNWSGVYFNSHECNEFAFVLTVHFSLRSKADEVVWLLHRLWPSVDLKAVNIRPAVRTTQVCELQNPVLFWVFFPLNFTAAVIAQNKM